MLSAASGGTTAIVEWECTLQRLLEPLLRRRSPAGARIALPGGRPGRAGSAMDELETLARSMYLAAPWMALRGQPKIRIDGDDLDVAATYRTAIVAGTDARGPESWIPLLRQRQALVEAAVIAANLWLARTSLWDPLSPREQEGIRAWLEGAARIEPYDNNWRLFRVTVLTVLKQLGGRAHDQRVRDDLDRIESFYLGDGWYADGRAANDTRADYYNFWAIHPDLLFWSIMDGDSDPDRRARIVGRASRFMETFPNWLAADGSYPCFGRSALYRTAILGVVPWAVRTGASPVPPGQLRRACRLMMNWFLGSPGTRHPSGTLSMGFTREHLALTESYSGPGSPYWMAKAFAVLMLPSDAAFWLDAEVPLPVEDHDFEIALEGPGFLLRGTRADGQIQLLNGGSVARAKKYSNLCYSSHFGFEIRGDQLSGSPDPDGDASLTFSVDGKDWHGRDSAREVSCRDGVLMTRGRYRLGRRGPTVHARTAMTYVGDLQLRLHRVSSRTAVYAREGGLACGWATDDEPTFSGGAVSAVSLIGRSSAIRSLAGYDTAPSPSAGGHNVLFDRSAVPVVRTTTKRSGDFWLASASRARAAGGSGSIDVVPDEELARLRSLLEGPLDGQKARRSPLNRISTSVRRLLQIRADTRSR